MKILAGYWLHMAPRCEGAGLKIEFHYNQTPGIHFKVEPTELGYRRGIEKGLQEGAEVYFSLKTTAIWVIEIQEDPINSSERAFYRAARLAIEQAVSLNRIKSESR